MEGELKERRREAQRAGSGIITRASAIAPPTGFEPVRLVPETSALSPELRGQFPHIVAIFPLFYKRNEYLGTERLLGIARCRESRMRFTAVSRVDTDPRKEVAKRTGRTGQ